MIRTKFWHKVPSEPVLKALPMMSWHRTEDGSTASNTAALMIYVSLIFMADVSLDGKGGLEQISAATYDDLGKATALSRKLIADGLKQLIALSLIAPQGSHQKRRYRIIWPLTPKPGWFKLPCQAIVQSGEVLPFRNFTLRSKHELHAMKLYLYLAARRNNTMQYSLASYETIFQQINIPERDIRKAISLLIGTGLLRSVDREHEAELNAFGPNKYFLVGSEKLPGFDGTTQ